MVKHTQTIRQQFADDLFESAWLFCDIGAQMVTENDTFLYKKASSH